MNRDKVFADINKELDYANSKWGTTFDDKNTINDFTAYIAEYLGKAIAFENVGNLEEQRKNLVKAAGLAISAIETFDRNGGLAPRHYDVKAKSA